MRHDPPQKADSDGTVARRCPRCTHKVRGAAGAFNRPRRCPKCGKTVRFVDYPRTAPPSEPHDSEYRLGLLDVGSYWALGVGTAMLGFFVLAGVAFAIGGSNGVLALAFCTVVVGGACGGVAFAVQKDYFRLRSEKRAGMAQIAKLNVKLAESGEQYQGFRQNYHALLNDDREDSQRRLSEAQEMMERAKSVSRKYLAETVKDVGKKLKPDNFPLQKGRLDKAVAFCRSHDLDVSTEDESAYVADLRRQYDEVVKKAAAREEQARIKGRIREEKKLAREMEAERRRAETEEKVVEEALAEARRQALNLHGAELAAREAEIAELAERLAEAESRTERTKAQAELTKAGHVYVISNRGSFGDGVFKVGMTRRLEPLDRVKELGDASVPFPFDVHMMISCDDAPALENALHKSLGKHRVNKVNLRKEFFRIDLESIVEIVRTNHGRVDYVAPPEALEYEQSLEMTDDDFEFVSGHAGAFESLDDDDD